MNEDTLSSSIVNKRYLEFVLNNLDKIKNFSGVSNNPRITFSDILSHPELPWNWNGISQNPNTTFDDILSHPELPWNWRGVSSNKNITFDDILPHPELPWDWNGVSQNPNITFDDILSHPELPFNYYNLSWGYFKVEKEMIKRDTIRGELEKINEVIIFFLDDGVDTSSLILLLLKEVIRNDTIRLIKKKKLEWYILDLVYYL